MSYFHACVWGVLWLGVIAAPVWAQTCDTRHPPSTPTANFFVNDDATLTELAGGLTWQRCAVGQRWNGHTCHGVARTFNWGEAQALAGASNGWRLPTLPELATIIERQCLEPRINLALFPATPLAPFWTSTPVRDAEGEAFALDFASQGVSSRARTERFYVRLVSGRE